MLTAYDIVWLATWGPLIIGLVWWYVEAGKRDYRGH